MLGGELGVVPTKRLEPIKQPLAMVLGQLLRSAQAATSALAPSQEAVYANVFGAADQCRFSPSLDTPSAPEADYDYVVPESIPNTDAYAARVGRRPPALPPLRQQPQPQLQPPQPTSTAGTQLLMQTCHSVVAQIESTINQLNEPVRASPAAAPWPATALHMNAGV